MYLLWKTICDTLCVPSDVKHYLAFHFLTPFARAKQEARRIKEVYNLFVIEVEGGLMVDALTWTQVERVDTLLTDPTIELDPRVPAYRNRIARFVDIISLRFPEPLPEHVPAFSKAMVIGHVNAFMMLHHYGYLAQCETPLVDHFLKKSHARWLSLPVWTQRDAHEMKFVLNYCKESKREHFIQSFIELVSERDGVPHQVGAFVFTFPFDQWLSAIGL